MPRFAIWFLCFALTVTPASLLAADWSDPSPHKATFIEVERGVSLELLDWGGAGDPVLLLAGDGDTGHVFDHFAPLLARRFRVFALTRRGFGASSQPADGYELTRQVKDIVSVADALKITKFDLVGHSIAGDEMNRMALMFPDRVHKLVYLDAAYDRVKANAMEAGFHLPHRLEQPTLPDLSSPKAMTDYLWKTECPRCPWWSEANVRATHVFAPDGHFLRLVTPASILVKVASAVEHPLYAQISTPALAIYALKETPAQLVPAYTSADAETRAALRNIFAVETAFQKQQREIFSREMHKGQSIEIAGANHYVFISNEQEVLTAVDRFLSKNDGVR